MNYCSRVTTLKILFLIQLIIAKTYQFGTCSTDEECESSYGDYYSCINSTCKHKDLFPLKSSEIWGTILLIFLSLLAASAGIGGGALLVPLSLIFFKFDTKQSVAFQNGLIFCSGTIKFIFQLSKKHPVIKHKTVIDYTVVLIYLPTILLGQLIGSMVVGIVPSFVQLLGLLAVLIVAIVKGQKKSRRLWLAENKKISQQNTDKNKSAEKVKVKQELKQDVEKDDKLPDISQNKKIINKDIPQENTLENPVQLNSKDEERDKLEEDKQAENKLENPKRNSISDKKSKDDILKKLIRIESTNFHKPKFILIIITTFTSLIFTFLRGTSTFPSILKIEKCKPEDWLLFFIYVVIILVLVYFSKQVVSKEQFMKKSVDYPYKDVVDISTGEITQALIMGVITGFVSAIVGLGGGLILSPILLQKNYIPQVVSFTSMYLVFLNKLVSSTVFIVSGIMPVSYLIAVGSLMAIGIVLVEYKLGKLVKKLGRQSIISIIFTILGVMSFGLVFWTGIGVYKEGRENKDLFKFGDFCETR